MKRKTAMTAPRTAAARRRSGRPPPASSLISVRRRRSRYRRRPLAGRLREVRPSAAVEPQPRGRRRGGNGGTKRLRSAQGGRESTRNFPVWFPEAELRVLEAAERAAGATRSAVIRRGALAEAERILASGEPPLS